MLYIYNYNINLSKGFIMLKVFRIIILFASLLCSIVTYAQATRTDAQIETTALSLSTQVFSIANLPVQGASTSDVTLVVFYDYNCPYSRILDKQLRTIITESNIRVIYRPVGIMDSTSPLAARAVLAAHKQGKFKELHEAFVDETAPLNPATIQSIINRPELGINLTQYNADYANVNIEGQVYANRSVFEQIDMAGVPAIIGAKLDASNNVLNNKVKYFAGVNRQDLVYTIFQLRN